MSKSNKKPKIVKHFLCSMIEVIPKRLLFVSYTKEDFNPISTNDVIYIRCSELLDYEGFFNDFGPYNICNIYHYCNYMNHKLKNLKDEEDKCIVQYTSTNKEERLNSAFAIGCYAIIYLNLTADQIYQKLTDDDSITYTKYNDASCHVSEYKLSLLDCFRAIEKSYKYGFFNFNDFNANEYEYYENVESGDLNWIVPNKFIAFCGPHQQASADNRGYVQHAPDKYFEYFRSNNVSTIVRLNFKFYESALFTEAGFKHYDLIFRDGSTPNDTIMNQFLDICEQNDGVIAVHCKAGLGRTGSLIGAYIMKHYHFTALEAIAWIRACRPGSVIGHQQQWLEEKQGLMWSQGDQYRKERKIEAITVHTLGIYSCKNKSLLDEDSITDINMNNEIEDIVEEEETQEGQDTVKKKMVTRNAKRSRSVSGISEKVDTMNINDDNDENDNAVLVTNDKNDNIVPSTSAVTVPETVSKLPISTTITLRSRKNENIAKKTITSSTLSSSAKTKRISSLIKKTTSTLSSSSPSAKLSASERITQGDELNQIKLRRAAAHRRSFTANANQNENQSHKLRHHIRAKSQTVRSTTSSQVQQSSDSINNQNIGNVANKVNTTTQKCNPRYTYVVLRTPTSPQNVGQNVTNKSDVTSNSNNTSNSLNLNNNKNKNIIITTTTPSATKKMATKDESTTKRASVRRVNSRAKLSRSVMKSTVIAPNVSTESNLTTTTTTSITCPPTQIDSNTRTTTANDTVPSVIEAPKVPETAVLTVEDIIGPITRSKNCRLCMNIDPNEDSNNNNSQENNIKLGKRSLSNSRLHEKKNKLSRKTQSLTISGIGCGSNCIPSKKLLKNSNNVAPVGGVTNDVDSQQSEVDENDESACDLVDVQSAPKYMSSPNCESTDNKTSTKGTIISKLVKKR